MSSDKIKCPHCECKVNASDVEKEDGMCPECGQMISIGRGAELFDDYGDGLYEDMNDMDDSYMDDEDRDNLDVDDEDYFDDEDEGEPDILEELNEDYEDAEFSPKQSKRGRKRKINRNQDED